MKKLPSIETHFPEWYQEVVYQAGLADQAPVRGCVVIMPYGTAIWDHMKTILNDRIIATGHQNAIFPLLIPESFFKKEAEHVEGFAPELAVVTHAGGKELEEKLVVRPTSETMIHYMFSRWIKSYRDLPLKINQWANVVRWEKRPRAFLRTSEFFWQEGHTAHATKEEALHETLLMLQEYVDFAQDVLAIPVIKGRKSPHERFAGAEETYTYEAFLQDGKAVQMGTSHLLSQNFAKSFDIKYQDKEGGISHPYLTSWGVTTRLVGALVGMHGDDKGLVLPPKIAPIQVVIVPILKKGADTDQIIEYVRNLAENLRVAGIRVNLDEDTQTKPGAKFYKWEMKGVPLRIEVGPRDVENKAVMLAKRIGSEKEVVALSDVTDFVEKALDQMQQTLFSVAKEKQQSMWQNVEKLSDFGKSIQKNGGIYQVGWCGNFECEKQLKQFQGSIRCLIDSKHAKKCFGCDAVSKEEVIVGKSY